MIRFIYEWIFTGMGIILSFWGMVRFFRLWEKTRYFWKGTKFLVCLILFCAYVVLFFDDWVLSSTVSPAYIVVLFRPLVLIILLTLILDVPDER